LTPGFLTDFWHRRQITYPVARDGEQGAAGGLERREPPDIDVYSEHKRGEIAIQWVFKTYGRYHRAMCSTVIRCWAKGALRDVGKALGLTEDQQRRCRACAVRFEQAPWIDRRTAVELVAARCGSGKH